MTLQTFLKLWAPHATPKTDAEGARNMVCQRRPKFSFIFLFPQPKAAQNGHPKCGTDGAVPPEGEGNPAEGGRSRVFIKTINISD